MPTASTRMERAAAFSALLVAVYASPLLLTTSRDAWDFIHHWDDEENFLDNSVIQPPLTAEHLRAMWTMGRINVYEPLAWTLKAVVCQLVGMDAWWVRVVTLSLHIAAFAVLARASAMLLELLELLRLAAHRVAAPSAQRSSSHWSAACLMSAAVLAVHPVHVQVVGWPSAQPYALAALFANLAIYAYLRPIHKTMTAMHHGAFDAGLDGVRGPREGCRERLGGSVRAQVLGVVAGRADTWSRTLVTTGLYACAFLSKSAAIFTPAAFVLLDLLLLLKASGACPAPKASDARSADPVSLPLPSEPSKARILASYALRKLPFVAVFAAFVGVTIWFNRHGSHDDADVLVMTSYERVVKALAAPAAAAKLVLWPTKLRLHYRQLERQYADVWQPDNLLPIIALALAAWAALHQCRPSVNCPQHALTLVYFVLTLLPVSGLIQHGIISGTADRYVYMGSISLVPYGGAFLASWVLPGSTSSVESDDRGDSIGRSHPELTTPVHTDAGAVAAGGATSDSPSGMWHRWALLAVVTCTLLQISTRLLYTWRTEETVYTYEIQMDPFDWRELDTLASMHNVRGDCVSDWERCRKLWERSFANAPTSSIKAELYLLRTRLILGGSEVIPQVCAAYEELATKRPDQPLVINNLGVCHCYRKEFADARKMFGLALANTHVDRYRAIVEKNIAAWDAWDRRRAAASGGAESVQGFAVDVMY